MANASCTAPAGPGPVVRSLVLLPLLAVLAAALSGCASQLLACPPAVKVPPPPVPQERASPVLFATDRLLVPGENLTFSSDLNPAGDHMSYGFKCVDPAAEKAPCDAPSMLLAKSQLLGRIRSAGSDVVLFIHGFNYTFDESLENTLRIVQRAKFPATPVAYAWPSQGKVSTYGVDYDMSEWTIDHLTDFIHDLAAVVPEGSHLHIVAHSMGNRALLLALDRLNLSDARLGQLILIAPDVDARIFQELVRRAGTFQRKTIYVSNHDLALRAAGYLHAGTVRAGDARKQYIIIQGIDTIDMSPLKAGWIGHSLYDYSQLIFDDLGEVLQGKAVTGRNLASCTVKSIQSFNEVHGTALPCVVYQLPPK